MPAAATIQLSPVDMVLRCAAATVGATETPIGSNAGPYVERVLKLCGLPAGNPWCAAHVAAVGVSALRAQWPVPKLAGVQSLYEWATKRRIVETLPEVGDLFVLWHPELRRFAHIGFVVRVGEDGACTTNEGNTSSAGVREGYVVAERKRRFGTRDRFIRWRRLLEAS